MFSRERKIGEGMGCFCCYGESSVQKPVERQNNSTNNQYKEDDFAQPIPGSYFIRNLFENMGIFYFFYFLKNLQHLCSPFWMCVSREFFFFCEWSYVLIPSFLYFFVQLIFVDFAIHFGVFFLPAWVYFSWISDHVEQIMIFLEFLFSGLCLHDLWMFLWLVIFYKKFLEHLFYCFRWY